MPTTEAPGRTGRQFDPRLEACLFCGSRDFVPFDFDFSSIEIARCQECGLKFMNPQYTDEDLSELYAVGNYHTDLDFGRIGEGKDYEIHLSHMKLLESFAPGGRLLSIGSGSGEELVIGRELGYEVEGYDIDATIAENVRSQTGIPFHSGDFFAVEFEPASFSVVYMDQVLEHVKQPRLVLERVWEILALGGVLFLGLPNIGGLSNRLKTIAGRVGLNKKRRGKQYEAWHHLTYYDPPVLEHLLTRIMAFESVATLGDPGPRVGRFRTALERRTIHGSTFIGIFRRPVGA